MNERHTPENILIVDDTPENLTVLRKMLTSCGYRVRPALSGEIALKTIAVDLPDLILLDIVMPGMDGYEVCSRLKTDEASRNIPVIFISALNDLDDKMKAFSKGGVDYISKPFHAQEVLARVKTHLTLHNLVKELEHKTAKLQNTLDEINQLRGLLPICANCKKVRDDKGYWSQIESYFERRSELVFSHGMCPVCSDELYGDEDWYREMKKKNE